MQNIFKSCLFMVLVLAFAMAAPYGARANPSQKNFVRTDGALLADSSDFGKAINRHAKEMREEWKEERKGRQKDFRENTKNRREEMREQQREREGI